MLRISFYRRFIAGGIIPRIVVFIRTAESSRVSVGSNCVSVEPSARNNQVWGVEMEFDIDSTSNINTVFFSKTFPSQPNQVINRVSLVRQLQQLFSSKNTVVMVMGASESGKTILLSQFVQYLSDKTVSYFIGSDYWSSSVSFFLQSICEQLMQIVPLKNEITTDSLEDHQLKQLFIRLYNRLITAAQNGKGPFYFVIDGLDKVKSVQNIESILSLLPTGHTAGVYVLLSSNIPIKDLTYSSWPIQEFSLSEVKEILINDLTETDIEKVYTASCGMPGYISEIKRQIDSGRTPSEVTNNLPETIFDLVNRECDKYDLEEKNIGIPYKAV